MSEWKDIATAPKDGRMVLLAIPIGQHKREMYIYIGRYRDQPMGRGSWAIWPGYDHNAPTHWQPLPAPPEAP